MVLVMIAMVVVAVGLVAYLFIATLRDVMRGDWD
jgi:hypothetical protein